ncbi:type II toxin-antitoxin system VapC family toxin [Luteolibacter flavescens]|uniref:Type II toxin-antitoxin system VapC family toxin n=1 Tax=Luteolibacter flavescens TaxID=1859460 RepID=A0ABT3FJQ8_9BACT|nr:type II toxin-antitoxin system VapC family toxin [Luteolibacter flavescens]MCW1883803.1 type II toxin-antitoxin system VapC family toxin [Luteolibacter flavescens]
MLYLDTSALLKLYILEKGSEAVQRQVASQDLPLPIWEIQEAELINALRLKAFWKEITCEQAEVQIGLFQDRQRRGLYLFPEIHRSDLMKTFRFLSAETPRLGCRTMDIFHVACAVQVAATGFMTFDTRQRELALHAGLNVITPTI